MLSRIGVFDSGAGGLTVLSACLKRFPARYFYLGDNARAPYGSRPKEEISAFTASALSAFQTLGADAAILACNTATAVCLSEMRKKFSFPVLGTEPAVLPAARVCRRALLLCTPVTAESARLKALLAAARGCDFTVHPCPRLAAAVEMMLAGGEPPDLSLHLPRGAFDGVVLGCTHYAFLKREIAAFYRAPVFDGAEGIARRLAALLPAPAMESGWGEREEINKSSHTFRGGEAVFLGESAALNEKIFKQTFFF